jgi:hypothetical protein
MLLLLLPPAEVFCSALLFFPAAGNLEWPPISGFVTRQPAPITS